LSTKCRQFNAFFRLNQLLQLEVVVARVRAVDKNWYDVDHGALPNFVFFIV